MVWRVRRYFDVRSGEGRRVLFSFLYVAVVAASFLLARPIRNALFLKQYGAYALVYVYAAVPVVLSLFVPIYARVAARFGSRTVAVATLIFFSSNVLLFWYAFRFHADAMAVRGSMAWYLAGRVLRLGQLFRGHRAGPGLELREPAVRYPPGPTALRPHRRRGVTRLNRRRAAGPSAGATDRRRRQHAAGPRGSHSERRGDRGDRPHAAAGRRFREAA